MIDQPDSSASVATRRSRILFLLEALETPITIDLLADELEATRAPRTNQPTEPTSWEDVHEQLYEQDLPALDEAGLIDFDVRRGIISTPHRDGDGQAIQTQSVHPDASTTRRDGVDAASKSTGETRTSRWPLYYLGTVGLSTLLLAVTVADVGPFAGVSVTSISLGIVSLFAFLALVHSVWD